MGTVQLNGSVDERIGREFIQLCERSGILKQRAIEAAAYWFVHKLDRQEFMLLMEEVADYIAEQHDAADEADTAQQLYDKVRKIAERPAGRRRRTEDAG